MYTAKDTGVKSRLGTLRIFFLFFIIGFCTFSSSFLRSILFSSGWSLAYYSLFTSFDIDLSLKRIRMWTVRSPLLLLLLAVNALTGVDAAPQQRGGNRSGNRKAKTPQQQAAAIPQGISQATDGSTILDTTATVK